MAILSTGAATESEKTAAPQGMVPELLSRLDLAQHTLSTGDPAAAYSQFQALAPAVPEARLVLVSLLRRGIGCPPQPGRAWRVLETLLDLDWAPPMVQAALWLRDTKKIDSVFDRSIVKDDSRSVQLLERVLVLEPDNADALCALGVAKREGKGCEATDANERQGLELLSRAVTLGHIGATFRMADLMIKYGFEHKDQVSLEQGYSLAKWVADKGHAHANLRLGEVCRDNSNMNMVKKLRDPRLQDEWLRRKAADEYELRAGVLGAPKGYHKLAEAYGKGLSAEGADFDKAVTYFLKAIEGGVLGGYDSLGWHFEKGGDVKDESRVDRDAAINWFRRGYEQREPWSTNHLGNAYDDALGVAPDPKRAEELYNQAIEFAVAEGELDALKSAKKDRQSLYTARCILGNEEDKYERLLADPRRLKRAKGLVSKLQRISEKSTRRAISSVGSRDAVMKDLKKLVGEWSAKEIEKMFL